MSDLIFAEKRQDAYTSGTWIALIVDDDPGIHAITRTVLRDLTYENRTLEFLSAYSRKEAESILENNGNIALVLLDVVMEEDDSGLRLVRYIREELNNNLTRIILRTGQPGKAPSQRVIIDYDINDYEEKTDLTAQKLYTTVIASLRNYRDLESLDTTRASLLRHRTGLSRISGASGSLFGATTPEELVMGVYRQLRLLIAGNDRTSLSSFAALQDNSEFKVIAADGRYTGSEDTDPRELIGEAALAALRSLKRENRNLLIQEGAVHLYEDARKFRFLLHVSDVTRLELQERQLLDLFASNVSIAFENLRLNREIIGTQEELITRLSEVVETRSHATAQHVRRVGEFCELIAEKVGMNEDSIHELKLASAMHDIGKIGIPDEILLKPDILTEKEFSIVKTHTEIGNSILKGSSRPLLQSAALICLQHHEKFDGTGYPNGLKAGEIHINARIVSICDVFDAITHGRSHRKPWGTDKAADYLNAEIGKAFDPALVDILIENLDAAIEINHSYPD
jgi:response regulator RpfG family c-di-GMP phosphodiesterase